MTWYDKVTFYASIAIALLREAILDWAIPRVVGRPCWRVKKA